jgi:hypothetical protein
VAQEKRSGTRALVIFLLVLAVIAAGFLLVKFVYPEALQNFATGFANDTLIKENQALSGELNITRNNLANVTDDRDRLAWDLREEQAKRFLWPVLIALLIIGLIILYLWAKYRKSQRGLTLDEAKKQYLPRIRKTFGFSEQEYPSHPKVTGRGFERVGRTKNEKDEAYFFIEYEFYPKHGHGYVRGVRSNRRNTITVAMLNFRHETHRDEFVGMRIDDVIEYAHKIELWGFHLQKSQREDDINKLIQDANSMKEIKNAVAEEQEARG